MNAGGIANEGADNRDPAKDTDEETETSSSGRGLCCRFGRALHQRGGQAASVETWRGEKPWRGELGLWQWV